MAAVFVGGKKKTWNEHFKCLEKPLDVISGIKKKKEKKWITKEHDQFYSPSQKSYSICTTEVDFLKKVKGHCDLHTL